MWPRLCTAPRARLHHSDPWPPATHTPPSWASTPSAALWLSPSGMPHRSPVRVAAPALNSGATEEPCAARLINSHSPAGYARSCGSASPRFAPSPGSQQSSYGSGLGAGLGSYGAPGVTGLGVPGSPSFLNGSTATSPFASECPQPTGSPRGGSGGSARGKHNGLSPPFSPSWGVDFQLLPYVGWTWPNHGEPLVLLSYDHLALL